MADKLEKRKCDYFERSLADLAGSLCVPKETMTTPARDVHQITALQAESEIDICSDGDRTVIASTISMSFWKEHTHTAAPNNNKRRYSQISTANESTESTPEPLYAREEETSTDKRKTWLGIPYASTYISLKTAPTQKSNRHVTEILARQLPGQKFLASLYITTAMNITRNDFCTNNDNIT